MKHIRPAIELNAAYRPNEIFSDDFEGTSLDGAKWYPFYPEWHGRKNGWFHPDNVSVKDGSLQLTARYLDEVPLQFQAAGYSRLTTACVRSRTRIRYGCFQACFKTMPAAICNAFWLNDSLDEPAKYKPGAFSDEIDIYECFGKSTLDAEDRFFNTCHRMNTPYMEGRVFSGNTTFTRPNPPKEAFHFREGFHTATFLWEKDRLRWYLDGRLTFDHPNDYYHHAMYLNFDCEPMFGWCGEPDPADLPAVYTVQYVRVWQCPDTP